MRVFAAFVFFAASLAVAGKPCLADTASEIKVLHALFDSQAIDPNLFAANFTKVVPVDGVQQFVDSYKDRLGVPTAYDKDGFQYRLTSPKGSIGVNIAFDQTGKISSLLFHDEMSAADLAALSQVMAAPKADPAWFQESFAHDVPVTQVDGVIATLRAKFGDFTRIDARKKGYYAIFARGEAHAQISVDTDGKIDYLAFTQR